MKRTLIAVSATLLLSGLAVAATPATPEEQPPAHHPLAAAAKEEAANADMQMGVMRDMHAKVQAAKTPAARAALMDEHMKAMQKGMSVMASISEKADPAMRGGKGKGHHRDMLTRRMEMMEMMMQMMMDREEMKPPTSR